jgi:hypothetical protein
MSKSVVFEQPWQFQRRTAPELPVEKRIIQVVRPRRFRVMNYQLRDDGPAAKKAPHFAEKRRHARLRSRNINVAKVFQLPHTLCTKLERQPAKRLIAVLWNPSLCDNNNLRGSCALLTFRPSALIADQDRRVLSCIHQNCYLRRGVVVYLRLSALEARATTRSFSPTRSVASSSIANPSSTTSRNRSTVAAHARHPRLLHRDKAAAAGPFREPKGGGVGR